MKRSSIRVLSVVFLILALAGCGTEQPTSPFPNFIPDTDEVIDSGGMMIVPEGTSLEDFVTSSATLSPQATPSCRSVTFTGNGGYIAYQTSSTGTVAWGIYLYSKIEEAGPWIVSVYVNNKRVDYKIQLYAPHGSIPRSLAPKGSIVSISASHTSNYSGKVYSSIPNSCIVP
jgi:hypothetical protein